MRTERFRDGVKLFGLDIDHQNACAFLLKLRSNAFER